jgi:hypothetical protein
MIPQRSISLISNSLMSAGGRRIPEAVTELDYVLAWLLSGLAGHPWRELFLARLNEIFAAIEAACGLRIAFDREDRHGHQNTYSTCDIKAHCPLRTT